MLMYMHSRVMVVLGAFCERTLRTNSINDMRGGRLYEQYSTEN